MAHEVSAWKQSVCSLNIDPKDYSRREGYSEEINRVFGEGGGLNANYLIVEAVAVVSSRLGGAGLVYGEDFVFKTGGGEELSFDFSDPETMEKGKKALAV